MNINKLDLNMIFQKSVVSAKSTEEPEVEEEEEELVDPQTELKEKCSEESKCVALNERVQDCTQKISSGKGQEGETCSEELFDFLHCVDHCVAKTLFSKLK